MKKLAKLKADVRDFGYRAAGFLSVLWKTVLKIAGHWEAREMVLTMALIWLFAGVRMQFTLGWAFIVVGVVLSYVAIRGVR